MQSIIGRGLYHTQEWPLWASGFPARTSLPNILCPQKASSLTSAWRWRPRFLQHPHKSEFLAFQGTTFWKGALSTFREIRSFRAVSSWALEITHLRKNWPGELCFRQRRLGEHFPDKPSPSPAGTRLQRRPEEQEHCPLVRSEHSRLIVFSLEPLLGQFIPVLGLHLSSNPTSWTNIKEKQALASGSQACCCAYNTSIGCYHPIQKSDLRHQIFIPGKRAVKGNKGQQRYLPLKQGFSWCSLANRWFLKWFLKFLKFIKCCCNYYVQRHITERLLCTADCHRDTEFQRMGEAKQDKGEMQSCPLEENSGGLCGEPAGSILSPSLGLCWPEYFAGSSP